jgi:hypothetical protein
VSAVLLAFNIGSTWSRTVRVKHRLRAFQNKVLRKTFGPNRDDVTGSGEDYITRSFMIYIPHQISLG